MNFTFKVKIREIGNNRIATYLLRKTFISSVQARTDK